MVRGRQIRMCGKIRAKTSWAATVDIAAARADMAGGETIALRVMANLPVIVFDGGERMVLPMRWGFPDPQDWRRPRPIHARAETIDSVPAFAAAFRDGRRGIVLAESFNEAPDDGKGGSGAQHVVTPAGPVGLAFVWRRFEMERFQEKCAAVFRPEPRENKMERFQEKCAAVFRPEPRENKNGQALFACVMVTVPANRLLTGLPTDRMPAVIAPEDWAVWLGEEPAGPAAVKACLRTVEDTRWTMTREERAASTRRARPAVSDPGGLF
jgi:putative SOS response-associated peptidase YedK